MKMNKENSYSLLQNQIEQLQQTVLKKQLLLDAVNSEKSSLEYRLADLLRDKAKTESLRRLYAFPLVDYFRGNHKRDEWCDVEVGEAEEKTHSRSIARILPDSTPAFLLEKVDQMDDVCLSVVQFLQRSPSFRLLYLLYFICVHLIAFILFFRKKLCVCSKQSKPFENPSVQEDRRGTAHDYHYIVMGLKSYLKDCSRNSSMTESIPSPFFINHGSYSTWNAQSTHVPLPTLH